jgi:alpha-amylase/alpha-mannosidase (GH57 family)
MYWSNFLHIYQPPTQSEYIVRKVTDESYRTIVRILNKFPESKITLNINAVLTEFLASFGLNDVINGLRTLAERGQIEFTGSAIYHPILPLIPEEEAVRQITLNTKVNKRYFGDVYNPKGFFPPEMCYSDNIARIVAGLGFKWIIVDEISFNGKVGNASFDRIYTIDGLDDFIVFFKERPFSAGITYGAYPAATPFLEALHNRLDKNAYLLSGTDGEVYGHHRPGQENLLSEVYERKTPATCTVSELIDIFTMREVVRPLSSSWSTWEDEMAAGIPYPQWQYPGHAIHALQWQLTEIVLRIIKNTGKDVSNFPEARNLVDKGLHSCQYWWASCRPWWSVDMIEWGAGELYHAVELLGSAVNHKDRENTDRLYNAIVETARKWQTSGEARRLKDNYKKEHPEVSTELTFGD